MAWVAPWVLRTSSNDKNWFCDESNMQKMEQSVKEKTSMITDSNQALKNSLTNLWQRGKQPKNAFWLVHS
jgi:hypothetical protein